MSEDTAYSDARTRQPWVDDIAKFELTLVDVTAHLVSCRRPATRAISASCAAGVLYPSDECSRRRL